MYSVVIEIQTVCKHKINPTCTESKTHQYLKRSMYRIKSNQGIV